MDKLERFKKRQAMKARLKGRPLMHNAVSPDSVATLLDCEVNVAKLKSLNYETALTSPIEVAPQAAQALLNELESSFNKARLESLLNQTQKDVLQSIVGPFGLGKIMSAYDKEGGNVDTIHNVRKEIYATEEEQKRYEERGDYNLSNVSQTVHSDSSYIANNKKISTQKNDGGVVDIYSGKTLTNHDNVDQEHILSAKQTHDDPGRVLAEQSTESIANIQENLGPTDESINRSKKAKSPEEFASYLEKDVPKKITKLKEKNTLTVKEEKELQALEKLADTVDPDKVREAGQKAQKAQDEIIEVSYYKSEKFIKNSLSTSTNEGVKMGVQQAFGVLLVELFSASFHEIRDAFNNGLEGRSLVNDIKVRLERIAKRMTAKWKESLTGFKDGFIAGFISNIITTLINVFATTAKRMVRMIREGVFSLLKALKLLLFPPENMTYRETAHEAMKLIAVGGIIVAGVALEEVIEKIIMSVPILAPIAFGVTATVVGSITAIAMALVSYLIDKMDLLGVIKIERDLFIIQNLKTDIDKRSDNCKDLLDKIERSYSTPLASKLIYE